MHNVGNIQSHAIDLRYASVEASSASPTFYFLARRQIGKPLSGILESLETSGACNVSIPAGNEVSNELLSKQLVVTECHLAFFVPTNSRGA